MGEALGWAREAGKDGGDWSDLAGDQGCGWGDGPERRARGGDGRRANRKQRGSNKVHWFHFGLPNNWYDLAGDGGEGQGGGQGGETREQCGSNKGWGGY